MLDMGNRDVDAAKRESSGARPAGEAAGDPAGSRPAASPLTTALRRARVDEAERSEVIAELRGAEIARLEMLRDALEPLLAEVPPDVELFDVGLMPGQHPRLFIDMIAFVEMGRDRRSYRLIQQTRYGRCLLSESERIDPIVEAITDYIAHRLIEREKALAADMTVEDAARRLTPQQKAVTGKRKAELKRYAPQTDASTPAHKPFMTVFAVLIDILGSAALCLFLALGAVQGWSFVLAWWNARHGG